MTDLAQRAREDAAKARRQEAEYEANRQPSNIQRLLAGEVERILGIEVPPLNVRDLGWSRPYYSAEVTVEGITFLGHYLSDTNGLHRTSTPLTAYRKRFGLTQRRGVCRIGDLDGWL